MKDGHSYSYRNEILNELGFDSYGDYLKSKLYRKIQIKIFSQKGTSCCLCGGCATELHHNRYHKNDLTGKTLTFIYPVCNDCHYYVEFDSKGQKILDFERIRRRFIALYKATNRKTQPRRDPFPPRNPESGYRQFKYIWKESVEKLEKELDEEMDLFISLPYT